MELYVKFDKVSRTPYNDLNVMQPKLLGSRWGGQYTLESVFGWLGSEFFTSAPKLEEISSVKVQCNYTCMCSLIRYHGLPNDLNVMQPMILGSSRRDG